MADGLITWESVKNKGSEHYKAPAPSAAWSLSIFIAAWGC